MSITAPPQPFENHLTTLHPGQASCPDVYRGRFNRFEHGAAETELARLYADEVKAICGDCAAGGETTAVAAFIAETLQSCGGQIVPPKSYFQQVYR